MTRFLNFKAPAYLYKYRIISFTTTVGYVLFKSRYRYYKLFLCRSCNITAVYRYVIHLLYNYKCCFVLQSSYNRYPLAKVTYFISILLNNKSDTHIRHYYYYLLCYTQNKGAPARV